jgi:hypothetical protein
VSRQSVFPQVLISRVRREEREKKEKKKRKRKRKRKREKEKENEKGVRKGDTPPRASSIEEAAERA